MTVGSKVKQTLSSLKGIENTLNVYSLQTQDEETSLVYKQAIDVVKEVMKDMENRIQILEFEEPQYKGL